MHNQDGYKIPKSKKEFQIQLNDGTKTLLDFLNDGNLFICFNKNFILKAVI